MPTPVSTNATGVPTAKSRRASTLTFSTSLTPAGGGGWEKTERHGLVYVADRANNRVQVFEIDGTFVEEVVIAKNTRGEGSVWDVTVSPDPEQTYLYVTDGANQRIWILRRDGLEILDSFGRRGRGAGEFHWVHKMAVDSHGNIYTGEVHMQRRVQKFVLVDSAGG